MWESSHGWLVAWDSCECVTRRKLQTPGSDKEGKRQETPTINPNNRQLTQLTDQAPGTIERAAWKSRNPSCECVLIRSSTLWLLPFTLLQQLGMRPLPVAMFPRQSMNRIAA